MPISYTISREDRLIRAVATGTISAPDLHRLIDSLLEDPELVPGLRGLYDASQAEPDITILQLAEVARRVLALLKRGLGRIAVVAQSPATYRVSKTFAVLAQAIGIDVDVFTERPDAEAWLKEANGSSDSTEKSLRR